MSLLGGGIGAGDIWSTGAFSFESPLKDLLDSGSYTTEDLLAQDELLQELRGLHPLLTQYFGTEEAVTQLVQYVVLDPNAKGKMAEETSPDTASEPAAVEEDENANATTVSDPPPTPQPGEWLYRYLEKKSAGEKQPASTDDPMLRHVRFPYMACEILCSELPNTIETLVGGYVSHAKPSAKPAEAEASEGVEQSGEKSPRPRLLDLLFSVLHDTSPGELDDYRAGYLDKILTVLFRRRPEAMTDYMNSGGQYGQQRAVYGLLQHLYSYSITQVAQRLLLPPRPKPLAQLNTDASPENSPDSADAAVAAGGQDILGGEDPDDDQDPDMNGAGVKCDWYKSKEAVLWLLDILQGKTIENKVEDSEKTVKVESLPDNLSQEQRLAMSVNASEVFITVIQNSMLSSDTMLTLTQEEVWKTLQRATVPAEGEKFSCHESFNTAAMNVVESLVLQLGGYGAVGTMTLLNEGGEQATEEDQHQQQHELIADMDNLLKVLPDLLEGFRGLLTHSDTKEWQSKTQFSQHVSVPLLGMSRLKIVRVLESLVLLGEPDIDHMLVESDCLRICLDLFWQFQWCSMLHQSVANLLVHVFEGQNVRYEIQEYFLVHCNLLGRLMDSFSKAEHVIEEAKQVATAVPDAAALADSADPLPVSEEDVEAAMEVGSNDDGGTTASASVSAKTNDAPVVSQSFRYGYMGHVIIICQALVQACTNEWRASGDSAMQEDGTPGNTTSGLSEQLQTMQAPSDATDKTGETSEMEPLLIAELVKKHTLSEQWKEFVATSLSSEITTQSTPLGGFSGPTTDPLATHRPGLDLPPTPGGRRPGLADDDMDMGPGASQPPPPRGMLGGGEIIDMDDNDLDVAASMMMTDFGLGRPNTTATADDSDNDSGQFSGSGDSEKSYNSGETNNEGGGYLFDDPLGKSGGLGIELGKLTQLGGKKKKPAPEAEKEEEENGSHSSSDEEPPREEKDDSDEEKSNGDENEEEEDNVPVMDLFAGNFNHGQSSPGDDKPSATQEAGEFDAFANFDAFAGSEESPEKVENASPAEKPNEDPTLELFAKAPPPDENEFFAKSPLVDDDGFGDFVSAEPTDETKPFDKTSDQFANTEANKTNEASSSAGDIDPFFSSSPDEDFTAAPDFSGSSDSQWKTSFTGNSFDDIDDLKPAPSDELAADAAAAEDSPHASEEQEATASPDPSDKSPTEEAVLVSSS